MRADPLAEVGRAQGVATMVGTGGRPPRHGFSTIGPLVRALALRSQHLFRDVPARQIALLAQLLREQVIPHGQVLFPADGRVDAMVLVLEGRVRQERPDFPPVATDAPRALGLVESLAGAPAAVTTSADTTLRALVLDRPVLLDVLEEHFGLVLHLRGALGREIEARYAELGPYQRPVGPPAALQPPATVAPDIVEALLWLQQIPELRALGVGVLAALVREETVVPFDAGEPLFAAGDDPRRFLVVAAGDVRGTPADGPVFHAGPGDVLGRHAVFSGLPYRYGAVAETAGLVIGVDAQRFWDVAEDHFHVARAALATLARRLLWLDETSARRRMAGIDERR